MSTTNPAEDSRDVAVDLPRLAGATILDEARIEHQASTLWAAQPALLVFVRHFG